MRHINRSIRLLIYCLARFPHPLFGGVRMQLRGGHPIVDGVYVNGNGPYRFFVDTGTSVNLIEANLVYRFSKT